MSSGRRISRRAFITSSCAAAGAFALGGKAIGQSRITTEDLSLIQHEVFLPSLPEAFDGFRIGMLSDPHLGTCSNADLFKRAIDLLSKEKLDLLVLAGDYVLILDLHLSRYFYSRYGTGAGSRTCSGQSTDFEKNLALGEQYFTQVALEVNRLNPTHGIIAVLGNHDRWNSAENCSRIFRQQGIQMLINDSVVISKGTEQLEFYGSDDYGTGIPAVPEASSSPRILVSHNPDFLSELSDSGLFSLGLAGHTHGGQIELPVIGPIGLNIQDQRLIQGLIALGQSQIFVSRGVGTSGLPWRINCPPEVNLIILRSGEILGRKPQIA